jgi:hypothetical protein
MLGLLLHLLTESDAPPVERRYQYVLAIHRQTLTSLARARQDPTTHPRWLMTLERAADDFEEELRRLEPLRLHHRPGAYDPWNPESKCGEGRL